VASCHRNRDKLRPDAPLGSHADLSLVVIEVVPKQPEHLKLQLKNKEIVVLCKDTHLNFLPSLGSKIKVFLSA